MVLLAMLVGMTMIMTACGGASEPKTLEKYAADDPEIQESIDSAMNDSNVLVEIKENSIIYTFDLSTMEGYTEELAKDETIIAALQSALEAAGSTFGGISKSIEEATEISGISTIVNYTWGDEVLVSKEFTSADAASDADAETDSDADAESDSE